jgi:uncharacterized membrane protein YphA (DoxX/SURF4 family)
MKVLLYGLGVCLAIYALQLAVVGLVVALAVAIVIGFMTRPREMLAMVVVSATWSLLERFPAQTLVGLAALAALSWIEAGLRQATTSATSANQAPREKSAMSEPLRLPPP